MFFYSDFMYLDFANVQLVKEMSPLFFFFDILPKRAEILKKTCLLNKVVIGGPFFMHHPVVVLLKYHQDYWVKIDDIYNDSQFFGKSTFLLLIF